MWKYSKQICNSYNQWRRELEDSHKQSGDNKRGWRSDNERRRHSDNEQRWSSDNERLRKQIDTEKNENFITGTIKQYLTNYICVHTKRKEFYIVIKSTPNIRKFFGPINSIVYIPTGTSMFIKIYDVKNSKKQHYQ